MERRTILFSGHVQGVGFRMTAAQLSAGLPLGGTVRNTSDGKVELVLEGESSVIDGFITRLREHFGSFIRTVDQTSSPAIGLAGGGLRITH
jgi:acylphosphatase